MKIWTLKNNNNTKYKLRYFFLKITGCLCKSASKSRLCKLEAGEPTALKFELWHIHTLNIFTHLIGFTWKSYSRHRLKTYLLDTFIILGDSGRLTLTTEPPGLRLLCLFVCLLVCLLRLTLTTEPPGLRSWIPTIRIMLLSWPLLTAGSCNLQTSHLSFFLLCNPFVCSPMLCEIWESE